MHTSISTKRIGLGRSCALAGVLVVGSVLPAVATPLERDNFVNSFEGDFDDCGFPVHFQGEERINLLINPRGPDGLAYFGARVNGTVSWTNAEAAASPTFSADYTFHDRDSRITDNGDGTLTITVTVSGRFTYSLDGKRLFHDAGQYQYAVLIDHAGTPTNPFDDEFIADLGPVRDWRGRLETGERDFCEDLNQFLN